MLDGMSHRVYSDIWIHLVKEVMFRSSFPSKLKCRLQGLVFFLIQAPPLLQSCLRSCSTWADAGTIGGLRTSPLLIVSFFHHCSCEHLRASLYWSTKLFSLCLLSQALGCYTNPMSRLFASLHRNAIVLRVIWQHLPVMTVFYNSPLVQDS